jgi:RimJ/RimL family protein N-acetyltransferase
VVARTAVLNPASGRVLEKNGFVVVGRQDSPEGELLVWDRPD